METVIFIGLTLPLPRRMFSYFWNSENHLNNAAFAIELLGCVIEVIIAIVAIANFPKYWAERRIERIKKLGESFAVVTAIIVLVVLISNRRINSLQELRQSKEFRKSQEASSQAQNAAKTAEEASANAALQAEKLAAANSKVAELEAKTAQRTIKPVDREKFIQLLKIAPKGRVQVQINGSCGEEITTYATEIGEMIASAGYDTPRGNALAFDAPVYKGVFIIVANATNQPPFSGPIQNALKAIGIDAQGHISGPKAGLDEDQVRIYVGGKP